MSFKGFCKVAAHVFVTVVEEVHFAIQILMAAVVVIVMIVVVVVSELPVSTDFQQSWGRMINQKNSNSWSIRGLLFLLNTYLLKLYEDIT